MHITFKQTFKMVRKFAVVLSQPSQGVFHPGSELEGKLTFELSEPKAYHYIKVAIIGEARVYHGDKHQSIHRQYINSQVIVWSKEQAIDGRLQSGPHSFPFQYTLPNRLHSSLFVPTCRCVISMKNGRGYQNCEIPLISTSDYKHVFLYAIVSVPLGA